MSRQAINWLFILAVVVIALLNPWYRNNKDQPIVTLGLDLRGGVEVLLRAVPEPDASGVRRLPTPEELKGVQEVVTNRVDPTNIKEIFISAVGTDRVLLQVPGEKNPDAIIAVIGETALMEWVDTGNQSFPEGIEFNQPGSRERLPEYAKYKTILSGADLESAYIATDQMGKPAVGFNFKPEGGDIFGQYTQSHVGQYLTVILDGRVITSPNINEPIWGGGGIISGSFTRADVDKVVRQLNAGALPVPLEILSSSVVGPTLGQESIDASFKAGLLGLGLVLLFMLVFYRLPGIVASIALILYTVLVLGYLSLFNATLTLPGIAGFILSVGMAVDGNIIIFERLREEIRWGKTLNAALEAAFARAWVAILDGNLTTIIAGSVLYFFGSGPVKGFAVTLIIGVALSMFSAVFVTRNILELLVRNVRSEKLYL